MKTNCITLLFLLGFTHLAKAQNLTGFVRHAGTQQPLAQAYIVVGENRQGTTSDDQGRYQLQLAEGEYTLVITHVGFASQKLGVQIHSDTIEVPIISLQPSPTLLNNQLVVTAQRSLQPQFEAMESVSVLNGQQILENGSRSMAEALIGVPGVWMQKTNHGGGSPFIRGLTGNQTLLLLDGIRLNNSTYRYGPNQYFNTIDVLNVAQVEAVRGAGSVLYGSDALGGAIQVLTQSPTFSNESWKFKGEAFSRLLSSDMEQTGRAALELANQNTAFRAGLSYSDFGDLVAGGNLGTEAPSAYDETGIDFKALFKLGSKGLLTAAYNGLFQSEVGRYDQVAQRGYQRYQFNPQNRQMAYLKFDQTVGKQWLDSYKIIASYQHSLEGREKQRQDSNILTEEEDGIGTLGLIIEGISRYRKNMVMVTGFEVYHDRVSSSATETNLEDGAITEQRGLYPDDSKATNIALFNSHTFDFKRFRLNAGWRLNLVNLEIEDATFGNTSIAPLALVGNLSGRYALSDQQAVVASVNTGFRAPNINDMSSFGSFDFGIEVPSDELSPERTLTFDLGYKLSNQAIAANFSIYRTQLFNLISRIPATFQGQSTYQGEDVYKKDNVAKSYIQGFEADFDIALNTPFSLQASLIYTYGQDTDTDQPMRRIPPLNGRTALTYRKKGIFGQLEWWYAGKQDRLSGGDISDHRIADGGTPAWNVLHLKAGYRWKGFHLQAGIQNIFDVAYRIHGSGVDGMGRAVWVSGRVLIGR